ncbi:MAG: methylated-DNA--[protein]-cysteine S-methyltransferase [Clostridia bacterium]|nr:methylated-DNA--[protein]-cysteine S-methyltransferase [Clostridia bacterium]
MGNLLIAEEKGKITHLLFESKDERIHHHEIKETPLLQRAAQQLDEYFNGKRKNFDLPLAPQGTEFQKKVWGALLEIPYGETRSYKDIAIQIENPKAFRAVGMANNRNPISIIIPCHRVVGHNGRLVGYGGGLPMKEYLLDLEKGRS